jgi:hypothetical protein
MQLPLGLVSFLTILGQPPISIIFPLYDPFSRQPVFEVINDLNRSRHGIQYYTLNVRLTLAALVATPVVQHLPCAKTDCQRYSY